MVEFDVPGHSESWCAGYPEVCPSTTCDQPLDVSSDATFELIDAILGDAAAVFPDQFVHLGGDEVNTDCWDSTPHVKDWLDARNMSADDGYASARPGGHLRPGVWFRRLERTRGSGVAA